MQNLEVKTKAQIFYLFHFMKTSSKNEKKQKNLFGDIIINLKKIKKNFIVNFDKLWIHGLLHLLGYTHKKNKEYKKMLKLEEHITILLIKHESISRNRFLNLFFSHFVLVR